MAGGIVKRGSTYGVKWYFEGKQRWKSFRTKKEAEHFRARITTEMADGTYRELKDIPFNTFASRWLEEKAQKVRPSTIDFYRPVVKVNLIPFFGGRKLKAIDYSLCKKYVASKVAEGRISNRTIGYHIMVLKMIFKEAIKEGYLKQNVVEYIERPKAAEKEFRILSAEELQKFLEHVNPSYKVLFLTASLTGLRQGEVLGLTWNDIDLKEGTLTVRHALQRGRLVEPKTEKAKRTVSLPFYLVSELRKHKLQSQPNPLDLVFVNGNGKPIDAANIYKQQFLPALKRASLPQVRFHDLRHGYASYCLALGQDLASVSARLGHASVTTTLSTYTHVVKRLQHEHAEEVAGVLLGNSVTSNSKK
jgi:integrase